MTDINLLTIIVIMCPFTVIAVFLGHLILKDSVDPRKLKFDKHDGRLSVRPFLKELVPILIAIIAGLGLGFILSLLFPAFPISKEAGLIIALCLSILWVWFENGTSWSQIFKMLTARSLLKIIYMIAGILIFKGVLTDSNAAVIAGRELVQLHVPLLAILIVLPFIIGLSGGIMIAFVGSTFPILMPLINSLGQPEFLPAYIMLVLSCGFAGVMLSPLHLCFQLSNEFFETTMGVVYRYLWLPCLLLIGVSVLYFWFLSWIMFYI
jgi:hypothetical protein